MARKAAYYQDSLLAPHFRNASKTRLLTAEREQALARGWRDHGDKAAKDELVMAHLRLANKIAYGYRGYGLPHDDLVSQGAIGLMQAANKFDPDKGFRFSTYAQWWIKAAIQSYILDNWSLVKIGTTAEQKKLFFKLRQIRAKIMQGSHSEHMTDAQCEQVAKKFGFDARAVRQMEQRLSGDMSLDVPVGDEPDSALRIDFIASSDPQPDEIVLGKLERRRNIGNLRTALTTVLNDRERDIFIQRRLKDEEDTPTLADLGSKYGLTTERVRQIEKRAFEKVQAAVKALDAGEEIPFKLVVRTEQAPSIH